MTAKKYLKKTETEDVKFYAVDGDVKMLSDFMEDYAKIYHQEKVKSSLGDVIGCAFVKAEMVDVTVIDESKLKQEGVVRVMWVNKDGKRETSFVEKNKVKKYSL